MCRCYSHSNLTCEDHNLASWQHKRVDCVLIDDHNLPVKLLHVLLETSPVSLLNCCNDALSNLLDQLGVGVVSGQGLATVLRLLENLTAATTRETESVSTGLREHIQLVRRSTQMVAELVGRE